jgi:hypothetical protein
MDQRVSHPTKEQVRAYMASRGRAHRPPPTPEEIRRQLGWRLDPGAHDVSLLGLYLLPSTIGQWATQLTLDWLLAPLRASAAVRRPPAKKMSA